MDIIQALILAIIQGISEWLPVSSSGHLVIAQKLMNLQVPVGFDVALHVGTLAAVIIFMRREIISILKAAAKLDFKSSEGKNITYIIIATIPAAIAGVLLKKTFEEMFSSISAVTAGLMFTGLLLFISERHIKQGGLDGKKSLTIGIMQAVSIIPGVSRSGSTISTGLILGVERETAARFSFLLSIPVVGGAMIVEAGNLINSNISSSIIIPSILVSGIVGYLSLKFLWKTILERKFHLFAYYCWILGLILVLAQIL